MRPYLGPGLVDVWCALARPTGARYRIAPCLALQQDVVPNHRHPDWGRTPHKIRRFWNTHCWLSQIADKGLVNRDIAKLSKLTIQWMRSSYNTEFFILLQLLNNILTIYHQLFLLSFSSACFLFIKGICRQTCGSGFSIFSWIRIQGFDDQKLEITSSSKILYIYFFDQKLQFTYP